MFLLQTIREAMNVVGRITAVFSLENKQIETRFYRFPKDHEIFIAIKFLNRRNKTNKQKTIFFKTFV